MNKPKPPRPAKRAETDAKADAIAGRLRAQYDDVLAEPVPEDMLKLLEDLKGDDETGPGSG